MKCHSCSSPATVHLTNIIDGQKKVVHLCQACAEQQQFLEHQELNLPAILQSLIGQHIGEHSDELARLACPACGIKYMEFRAEGRLGCPLDYAVFGSSLKPLLERIHRAGRHVGKSPRRRQFTAAQQAELVDLQMRQRRAIETEAYEEAARLRDLLREKEATDESG